MKIAQTLRNRQDFWPRLSLVLSIGFLALSIVLLILGNRLLEDSKKRVLEQRRAIAQITANQIDRSLFVTIHELEQTLRVADFDPSDPKLDEEAQALVDLSSYPALSISRSIFLDPLGKVILAYPPNPHLPGTNLSDYLDLFQAPETQDVQVSTPWHDSQNGNLVTAITIRIYDRDHFLGWLSGVVDLDESRITTLLEDAVALDHSAHAILADSQGRSLVSTFNLPFLSPGEHYTFYRQAIARGQLVVEVVPFELDLPGEPEGHLHMMAFTPLKNAPWGVSIGGDVVKETFAGSYLLFIGLASIFILSILLIWGATLVGTKRLLEPVRNVNLKFDISRQIAIAKDWEELTSLIVRIPSTFAPISGARLLSRNRDSEFELVSEWRSGGNYSMESPSLSQPMEVCEACILSDDSTVHTHAIFDPQPEDFSPEQYNCFCLPLVHQENVVGTLQFWLPSEESLSKPQIDVLTSVASDMAIAVESAQLQRSNLDQIKITEAEQRRIFRRLHDTLGQNIAFLRLKLDQYSSANSFVNLADIHQDIKRMRDIANEAYGQIRSMLTDLHPETQSDLSIALRARASSIADRANFKFELSVEGHPVKIPQDVKRHVLFICYEALNNIEQHAYAKMVSIHLRWSGDGLTITIRDDGTGFDPGDPSSETHFGLEIMQERALAIKGRLSFISTPKDGTEVNLWIPLSPSPDSREGGVN